MMKINESAIEHLINEILKEREVSESFLPDRELLMEGVNLIKIHVVKVYESERYPTGNPADEVYIKPVLNREENHLCCDVIEIGDTNFTKEFEAGSILYLITGSLEVVKNGKNTTMSPGEILSIKDDTKINMSVYGYCRMLHIYTG